MFTVNISLTNIAPQFEIFSAIWWQGYKICTNTHYCTGFGGEI